MSDPEILKAIKDLMVTIQTTNPQLQSVQDGFIGAVGAVPGLVCYTAKSSASWRAEIESSVRALPIVCRNILSAHDVNIVLAGHPADVGRISTKPNEDDFYKRSDIEIPAHYVRCYKSVVLPERHFNKDLGKNISMYHVPQIVAHELTHALDDILKIAEQPEAISAYKMDVMALRSPQSKKKYGYLLQNGKTGREEAIAEIGSLIWTGKNVTGSEGCEWRYLSSWMIAYFNEIAATYIPKKDLTTAFKNAAAKKAENVILRKFIVADNIGYGLMSGVAEKYSRHAKNSGHPNLPVGQMQKEQVIRRILHRQGDDVVTKIWLAHNEKMNPLPRPDLSP